uniref:sulfite oxidase n=1 Tax=Cacopsylla melanoneura TaxID=428564 RepID=A0A8D9A398_9HEMI
MNPSTTLSRLKRLLFKTVSQNDLAKKSLSYKHTTIKLNKVKVIAGVGITTCVGYSFYHLLGNLKNEVKAASKPSPGEPDNTLPWYTISDVQNHKDSNSIWVVFKQGVYDITQFVQMHPGGDIIMKAAGSSIEPFWAMYGVHMQDEVFELLETYRIGNISMEDSKLAAKGAASDPYAFEPVRSFLLKATSLKPFNAEPPASLLVDNFLTPADIFYVRNHLPVPVIDEVSYRLEIQGSPHAQPVSFSLEDIKKLPPVTITAAVMCAGNRRSEMSQVKPVKGLSWGPAAVGNATWTGARLVDVLRLAGLNPDPDDRNVQHVHFEGLDIDLARTPYAASIPATKALDPRGDVILAYEMNGEPLTRDHGAPLRAVVPGVVGARNVKWLGKVILSPSESTSHWQQNDYKGFSPSTDWDTVDFSKSPAIQELPVISAICLPAPDTKVELENQTLDVQGYAWSGGGKAIVRVDVTIDQGRSWHVAKFTGQDSQAPLTRHWGWTLWKVTIPVDPNTKEVEIWSKAVDASYNTQPESFSNVWNLRGVLANAYHRVRVSLT